MLGRSSGSVEAHIEAPARSCETKQRQDSLEQEGAHFFLRSEG